jgi:hypothetical protein
MNDVSTKPEVNLLSQDRRSYQERKAVKDRPLMSYALKTISVLVLIVVSIIVLCIAADWLCHLRWGHPWWSGIASGLTGLVAIAAHHGTSEIFRRVRAN